MGLAGLARRHRGLLVVLSVTFLCYLRLWPAEFSWDDQALIVDNQVTGSLSNIGEFFTRDLWSTTRLSELKSGYYRPLMLLSLALDRAAFGLDASWAHLHSLMWHLLTVTALYALVVRLFDVPKALLAATIFALHPVQSEVIALVAARNDSMAAAFTLLAIVLLLDRKVSPARLAAAGVLSLLGLLSKESGILAAAMLLALDLARWRRPGHWPRYATLVAALVVYLGLRSLAEIGDALTPSPDNYTLVARNGLGLAGVYGSLLVWPWPLTPARHIHYLPPLHQTLFELAFFLALVGLALIRGRDRALVISGLVWATMAFVPTLAATLDKGLLGERYLYLPVGGLALAMAAALPGDPPRWIAPSLGAVAVLALQLRLPDWKDSMTVWRTAHHDAPSAFTHAGFGWYLNDKGETEEALKHFVGALEEDPPYHDVCDMIVQAYIKAGRFDEAARLGRWAIEERGCRIETLIGDHYAVALAGSGQWEEAVQVAASRPGGPKGPAAVVIAAAKARTGEVDFPHRVGLNLEDTPGFEQRVIKLLKVAGEDTVAARVAATL